MIRQSKSFLILMDNYNRVLETTKLAYNSAGSSAEEFARWQDSLEGRVNNLKSAIEQFSSETINSQFIKSIIEATTAVVDLGTAMGGAIPVVLALSSAFATFKAVNIISNLGGIASLIAGFTTALPALALASTVAIGVVAISRAINETANEARDAKLAVNTLSEELDDLGSKRNSIEDLGSKYINLGGFNFKGESEDLEEYYQVQNKLKELMPELEGYYNEQGNFIIKNVNTLKDLTNIQDKYIQQKREELALQSKESLNSTNKAYEEELQNLDKWQKKYDKYKNTPFIDKDILENAENKLKKSSEQIKQYLDDMEDGLLNVVVATEEWSNLTEDKANIIRSVYSELTDEEIEKYIEQIELGTFKTEDFIKTILSSDSARKALEELSKKAKETSDEFVELSKVLETFSSKQDLITSIKKELDDNNKLSLDNIQKLIETYPQLENVLSNYLVGLASTSDVLNEIDKAYKIDVDNYVKSLKIKLSNDAEFLNNLSDNQKKQVNDFADSYDIDLENFKTVEKLKLEAQRKVLSTMADNIKQFNGYSIDGLKVELRDLVKRNSTGKYDEAIASIKEVINEYESVSTRLDDIVFEGVNFDPERFIIDDTKSNKTDKWLEQFQAEYAKIQYERDKDIISSQQYYDKLENLRDRYFTKNGKVVEKYKDQFRQYDLELYNLDKQLSQERLQDLEFNISLSEFTGGEDVTSKQITIYKQMQDEVHKMAERARVMGLDENNDYIQQLRSQWIEYASNISDLESKAYSKLNKSFEDKNVQINLRQQLVNEDSQEYLDLEQQKYDNIIAKETAMQKEISRLQAIGTADAKEKAEELIDTYYDLVSERYNIIKNLQSTQIGIYNKQIESLEKQKDALGDLHKYTMDMIRDELNARKKLYQDEIKGIEAVFNAKKKALRDEQDSRNYERGLTEKSSLVADLENQLALIKNDETAIAKRKKLEEDLAKAKQDLADYQYDHSIDLQEKALDGELKMQTDALEEQINKIDDTLSNEVKMRELADKRIKQSGEKLYNELINYSKEYGKITEDEIKDAWDNANISLKGYKDTQEDVLTNLKLVSSELSKIKNLNIDSFANTKGLSTMTFTQAKSAMQANSSKWFNADEAERKRLHNENEKIGKSMGWVYDPKTGKWYYFDEKGKKIPVYHSGGIVGGSGTKDTEELAKLLKGELVITPPQADKVMDMITNNSNSSINISMPIVIEGNADSDTVKSLEKQVGKIADTVIEKLTTARNNTGFKKKPKFV